MKPLIFKQKVVDNNGNFYNLNSVKEHLQQVSYGENAGGENLFKGYTDLNNYAYTGTYNGYPVIYSNKAWGGAFQKDLTLPSGKTYVFSFYAKGNGVTRIYGTNPSGGGSLIGGDFNLTDSWVRYSAVYTTPYIIKDLKVECITAVDTYIACFMVEEGNTLSDYKPYVSSNKQLTDELVVINSSLANHKLYVGTLQCKTSGRLEKPNSIDMSNTTNGMVISARNMHTGDLIMAWWVNDGFFDIISGNIAPGQIVSTQFVY